MGFVLFSMILFEMCKASILQTCPEIQDKDCVSPDHGHTVHLWVLSTRTLGCLTNKQLLSLTVQRNRNKNLILQLLTKILESNHFHCLLYLCTENGVRKKIQNEFFPNVTATFGSKYISKIFAIISHCPLGYCTLGKWYLHI